MSALGKNPPLLACEIGLMPPFHASGPSSQSKIECYDGQLSHRKNRKSEQNL